MKQAAMDASDDAGLADGVLWPTPPCMHTWLARRQRRSRRAARAGACPACSTRQTHPAAAYMHDFFLPLTRFISLNHPGTTPRWEHTAASKATEPSIRPRSKARYSLLIIHGNPPRAQGVPTPPPLPPPAPRIRGTPPPAPEPPRESRQGGPASGHHAARKQIHKTSGRPARAWRAIIGLALGSPTSVTWGGGGGGQASAGGAAARAPPRRPAPPGQCSAALVSPPPVVLLEGAGLEGRRRR